MLNECSCGKFFKDAPCEKFPAEQLLGKLVWTQSLESIFWSNLFFFSESSGENRLGKKLDTILVIEGDQSRNLEINLLRHLSKIFLVGGVSVKTVFLQIYRYLCIYI